MLTRVQKWGNNLAIRIPKEFARVAQVDVDSIVQIAFIDDRIIITPIVEPSWTLEELLAGIHKNNIPEAINAGNATGIEIW